MYCNKHYQEAIDLYNEYKKWTNYALINLDDHSLTKAIELRKKYNNHYTWGDKGAHASFIALLERLLFMDKIERKRKVILELKGFNEIWTPNKVITDKTYLPK